MGESPMIPGFGNSGEGKILASHAWNEGVGTRIQGRIPDSVAVKER